MFYKPLRTALLALPTHSNENSTYQVFNCIIQQLPPRRFIKITNNPKSNWSNKGIICNQKNKSGKNLRVKGREASVFPHLEKYNAHAIQKKENYIGKIQMKRSYEVWQDKNNSIAIILAFIYLILKTHMGQHAPLSKLDFCLFVCYPLNLEIKKEPISNLQIPTRVQTYRFFILKLLVHKISFV